MQLIGYYHRSGDVYREASTWSDLGKIISYDDAGRAALRLSSFQNAYLLFKKAQHRMEEIGAYKDMADVHLNTGKLDLAEKELLQVLDEYHKIGYKELQYTYDLLAVVYNKKQDQINELKYRLLMLQNMKETGPIQQRLSMMSFACKLYLDLKRYDKCIELANKALALYWKHDHDDYYYIMVAMNAQANLLNGANQTALDLLTKTLREKNISPLMNRILTAHLAYYYKNKNQYERAEYFYLKALSAANTSETYLHKIYTELAEINIYWKRYSKARTYLDQIATLTPVTDASFHAGLEHSLFKVDSAEGHFTSSISHYQRYKAINDSLYNIAKNKQIAELDVQYETKQKEQSIQLLNSDARTQKAKLEKVNLQRNIILAALGLFGVAGFMAYRFYRYKQKANDSIIKSHELIKQKNKQLEFLVEEKEWLLKEVHHRVKNNLHTIICLLESQAAYLENDALKAIEKSQNRIYTMSLIHQKLYQSDDIKTIDMSIYVPELIQYLKDSFDVTERIYFQVSIDEISLDPAIAIPVALIINEALTNSIKYAFPGNQRGEISVFLHKQGDLIVLELADNGVGMDMKVESNNPVSLGLQLMRGLTKEILGDIQIKSSNGFMILVSFKNTVLDYNEVQQSEPVILD